MSSSYRGSSESEGESKEAVLPLSSTPPLMKDARNFGRTQPVRSTRNVNAFYKDYTLSPAGNGVNVRLGRSKNGASGRARNKVLTSRRKQVITAHLHKALLSPLRFRVPGGIKILKEELLIELRNLTKGRPATGQISRRDVDRWLKNFGSTIHRITQSDQVQPQRRPSVDIPDRNRGSSGVSSTINNGNSVTSESSSALDIPADSSNQMNSVALTTPSTSPIQKSEPRPPSSSTTSTGMELSFPFHAFTSLIHPSSQLDSGSSDLTTTSGLSSEFSPPRCMGDDDDDFSGSEQVFEAASPSPPPERNQTVDYSERRNEENNLGLHESTIMNQRTEQQEMISFVEDIRTHVYAMKRLYRKHMVRRREAHASLEVFCHILNTLTGFADHYMDPRTDPSFYTRHVYY